MTKDTILSRARDIRGFVVTQNTKERTLRLVEELLASSQLKVVERFQNGHGCRLVPM